MATTNEEWLNVNQSPDTLNEIHGRDYYDYLESFEFTVAFLSPMGRIISNLPGCKNCLDVGCGSGRLSNHVNIQYRGFDGSEVAIKKCVPWYGANFKVDRIENPNIVGQFDVIVFGGLLAVLVKNEYHKDFLQMYISRYEPRYILIYDLETLDTGNVDRLLGAPSFELHSKLRCQTLNIPEVKLARKILLYQL